jgi:protein-S-isoprenylcysteine O-methyltransferase Ste14
MNLFLGLITPLVVYAVITLLHLIIPAKRIKGYVKNETTGKVMNYRINGKFVLWTSIIIWFLLGYFNIVPYTWLYEIRWLGLIGAVVIGLSYTFYTVLKHPSTGKSLFADFWFGRIKDPQLGDSLIDAKVWLYLVGAVMLQLNVLSFAAYHITNVQNINYGFLLGCAMLTWFCNEYLIFEKIHLWTYDFIAERVGFKLGFGCLAFYPYFYSVALWFTAHLPNPGHPVWLTILFGALFLCGWVITRGANMQKYFFKITPGRKFLWIKPEVLSDNKHSLLANGYWGASRHINYLGEILQAIAIALASGYFGLWMVWLYPVYYIALMLTRQADDDKVCKAKYGELWDQYTRKVKYKIFPFIY